MPLMFDLCYRMPHMKLLHVTAAHTGSVIYHNWAINDIDKDNIYY